MTTPLTEQARKESGHGLTWAASLTTSTDNGDPNAAPDPLDDTVGFDAAGYTWGVFAIRCDPGTSCTYRLHFRWGGLAEADDGWDEVRGSETALSAGKRTTERVRVAGAARVYVELLSITGGGNVKVLWANATGVIPS